MGTRELVGVPTRVLAWYLKQGPKGDTVDDCSRGLALANQSVSGSVTRLTNAGKLVKTDAVRVTRLKRPAAVYVHVNFAKGPYKAKKAGPAAEDVARAAVDRDVVRIFWRYVEARKKAGKDERAIQRALMKMMKDLAIAAEPATAYVP